MQALHAQAGTGRTVKIYVTCRNVDELETNLAVYPTGLHTGALGQRLAIDVLHLATHADLKCSQPQGSTQEALEHCTWRCACLTTDGAAALRIGVSALLQQHLPG